MEKKHDRIRDEHRRWEDDSRNHTRPSSGVNNDVAAAATATDSFGSVEKKKKQRITSPSRDDTGGFRYTTHLYNDNDIDVQWGLNNAVFVQNLNK